MLKLVRSGAGRIDAVLVCPHDYEDNCECRKPKPGMLLRAASDYSIDLHNSWMVGDSVSDIAAGQAAGCRTIMVGEVIDCQADRTTRNLPEAASFILKVQ
jgi:D-glycero-D-manno-heptose 1,7-bisphosphate phosphatase